MSKTKVLVIDDDKNLLAAVRQLLESNGLDVTAGHTCAEAERLWNSSRPDLALLDYSLPDGNAIDLIHKFKSCDATVPIIVLTGKGTTELVVSAVKAGAENFLNKPADPSALLVMIERSLENSRNRQTRLAEDAKQRRRNINPFLGVSRKIQELRNLAERVASAESPVLLQGETGTGKGVLARWLHQNSPRAAGPYVDLNCAGLARDLLETELFGHEKGAFTGAVQSKMGLFEAAHKGTLFLDEIADVDPSVQPKLLKVLEEKTFHRLGEVKERSADVRLIAATHRPLAELVRAAKFRDDLYFRISTIPVAIPPLRERREDIPLLGQELLSQLSMDMGKKVEISPGASKKLQNYSWPGNIRELRNVLERAILLGDAPTLDETAVRFDALEVPGSIPASQIKTFEELEKENIKNALNIENGRVEFAAKRLGIHRTTLYLKLKQYGMRRDPAETLP
jgi:DNA-binding NtrC family response regulator